jgi:hypothetical protein
MPGITGLVRRAALAAAAVGAVVVPAVAATSAVAATPPPATSAAGPASAAHYDHVFVVMEENHGFSDVIGNPAAPNLNALADRYGLATSYYGIGHPSEPNYVALLGGSTFGVASDNPYYVNSVHERSLVSQMDQAGISWKAYLQGLPHPGYQGICYPAFCNGTPDKDPLYVSKHNPVANFTTSWNAADRSRQVPAEQLGTDLAAGHVPSLGLIVPDECHDQHGDPPYCLDSGSAGGSDPQDQRLVATGDQYLGQLMTGITSAPFWSKGNNAVVVTYDEGNDNGGCCGANPGGGRVATVVVTSHGPRHVQDATPYNHYSLLATVQRNFGLGCLAATCDTSTVTPMTRLLVPSGQTAQPYQTLQTPAFPTPTPTPTSEPVTTSTATGSGGGWTVEPAPVLGKNDNSFGGVSAASPNDVWAVGNYIADAPGTNPDATLTLAAHWDGHRWASTPTPNAGPNFSTLFGVASTSGQAWAVGTALGDGYTSQAIVEHWDGSAWSLQTIPTIAGQRSLLYGVTAVSPHDVWAVGLQQDNAGRFATLVEHYDGHSWTLVPAIDPGKAGNAFYAVASGGQDDVWAVGQRNDPTADRALVEHFDGHGWSVVENAAGAPSGLLDAVTVQNGRVLAAGQTDDAIQEAHPLVAEARSGSVAYQVLTGVGGPFSNLNGITLDRNGQEWVTGTTFDPKGTYDGAPGGVQQTLVATSDRSGWHAVAAPSPGTADRVLGQVVPSGDDLITVGYLKEPNARQPLVEIGHGS